MDRCTWSVVAAVVVNTGVDVEGMVVVLDKHLLIQCVDGDSLAHDSYKVLMSFESVYHQTAAVVEPQLQLQQNYFAKPVYKMGLVCLLSWNKYLVQLTNKTQQSWQGMVVVNSSLGKQEVVAVVAVAAVTSDDEDVHVVVVAVVIVSAVVYQGQHIQ